MYSTKEIIYVGVRRMFGLAQATRLFLTPAFAIKWLIRDIPINYVIEALKMGARTRENFQNLWYNVWMSNLLRILNLSRVCSFSHSRQKMITIELYITFSDGYKRMSKTWNSHSFSCGDRRLKFFKHKSKLKYRLEEKLKWLK